jgi:hypothetical protein
MPPAAAKLAQLFVKVKRRLTLRDARRRTTVITTA